MNMSEAFYWVSMIQLANDNDEQAMELLNKENGKRTAAGQESIQAEVEAFIREAKAKQNQ